METWNPIRRMRAGCVQAAGLGCLAGAMETVALAASEKLSLGMVGFAALGVTAVVAMGLFGALIGLLTAPVHLLLASRRTSTALAWHLMFAGFLLCGWYFWQGAWLVYTDERAPGAIALALMPLGFTGVIYFNSRFLNRRAEIGKPLGLPWLPTAFGASVVIVIIASIFFAFRDTGGTFAYQEDRNVLIVTVEGWAHDDLGPEVTAFAQTATHFDNAVTPIPSAAGASASVLTGLHPLRHKVLFDNRALSSSYRPLTEVAAPEGYATGAFVSTSSVNADSGLSQGFKVYDDDFSPLLPGMLRVNVIKVLTSQLGLGRSAGATASRFEGWMQSKAQHPFIAWVHLPEPDDAAIGRILASLDSHGVTEETLVFLMGTSGKNPIGLRDDAVRVPLFVRAPDLERKHPVISQQVRTMDLAGTAVTWLGLETLETEGVDLMGYLTGKRTATIWCALIGERPDGGLLIGLRNNGIKYIKHHGGNVEELFQVESDPEEKNDLKASQPETLEQARRLLQPEEIRLDRLSQ